MDINQIGQEYILDSRIRGERKIAGIRLILLIPLTGFVLLIFFGHVADTGVDQALLDIPFWIELFCITLAGLMSLWVFRITKQRRYYAWMKYLLPFIDISFITLIISSIVRPPFSGVLFTSASPYLYFIFICTCVFRSSPASVIFTGVYSTLSYLGLWFYAVNGLGIMGRWTTDFTNEYGAVSIMMDDEIIKPLIFLVVTAVLAFMARWFNRLIIEQIKLSAERDELRDIFTKDLKEVTANVDDSSDTLLTTSRQFTAGIEQMRDSADKIDLETKEEFAAVEQTSATIIQMIKSIESVSKNIQTQVGQVQSIVASIQEMSSAINQITHTSKSADQVALNLLNAAEDGENTMEQVVTVIKQTEKASKRVEEIVEMISSIADTTDLLSMNAAIEAAHAGAAGRGFAVVADEIRKLAETTSENARLIGQILKDMLERIAQVVTLSDKASASLKSILNDAKQTSDINSEVLHAMEEESATVNEVVKAIQILSNITEEVKQASEEQAIGSNEILTAINHIRSRANQVSSLTEVQAKKSKEIEEINQELTTLVANNSQIIEKLDNLVSKL